MKRHFTYSDDKSNKFWEIEIKENFYTTRYGKVGSDGQRAEKEFADETTMLQEANKLISEKIKKGYIENVNNHSAPTTVQAAPAKKEKTAKENSLSVQYDETNFESSVNAIQTLLTCNHLMKARKVCEKALTTFASQADQKKLSALMGEILQRLKQYTQALPYLEQAQPESGSLLAETYYSLKEYDKAVHHYINTNTYKGYWQAGLLYIEKKEDEKALQLFERAALIGEQTSEKELWRCYFKWAFTLQKMKWNEEAEKLYEKALALGVGDAWTYNNYAILQMGKKALDKAQELLLAAIEHFPEEAVSYFNMACLQGQKGNADETMRWVEQAVDHGYTTHERIKYLETDSDLELIRNRPRYQELMKDLKNYKWGRCDGLDINAYKGKPEHIKEIEALYYSTKLKDGILPADIGKAKNVTVLRIRDQGLKKIGKEIGALKKLTDLQITENPLNDLPEELFSLELHRLDLELKNLNTYPAFLEKLNVLVRFNLKLNNLKAAHLPDDIARLKKLHELELMNSEIETISDELGSLVDLTQLAISNTSLKCLPATVSELQQLKSLDLVDNPQLAHLPESIALLPKLDLQRVTFKKNGFPSTEAEQLFREVHENKTDRTTLALHLALLQRNDAYVNEHAVLPQVLTALNSKVSMLRTHTLMWLSNHVKTDLEQNPLNNTAEVYLLGKFVSGTNGIKEQLKETGARVTAKFSSSTTHILIGEKPGDKLSEILQAKVQWLTENAIITKPLANDAKDNAYVADYPKAQLRMLLLSPDKNNLDMAIEMLKEYNCAKDWLTELFIAYQFSEDKQQKKDIQLLIQQHGSPELQSALTGKYGFSSAADKKINEYLETIPAKAGLDTQRMAYAIFKYTTNRGVKSAVNYILQHGSSEMKTEMLHALVSGDGKLKLEGWKYLITDLPEELSTFTHVTELDVNNTKLKELPLVVTRMTGLQKLNLNGCKINKLPKEISNLVNLKVLVLSNCSFKKFPDAVLSLPNLEELRLDAIHHNSSQNITAIPDGITALQKLKLLDLEGNQLKEIPSAIGQLKTLELLNIKDTALTEIPENFSNLTNCKRIYMGSSTMTYEKNYLNRNTFNKFPETLLTLTQLEVLAISGELNIPESIQQLKKLKDLMVHPSSDERLKHLQNLLPNCIVSSYSYYAKDASDDSNYVEQEESR